jgi:hypothetical protein
MNEFPDNANTSDIANDSGSKEKKDGFQCNICRKIFKQSEILMKHMQVQML